MDSSFVFKTQQLDYSACHFMQHVFVLFAFKAFFSPWAEIPECLLH